jgi:hypothetical protein
VDPVITPIAAAIAAGAAAGLKDDATQAVRDAFGALKSFLGGKYPKVDLGPLEAKPDSHAKQMSLAEDLADTKADRDSEVLRLVRALEALTPPSTGDQVLQQNIEVRDHGTAYTAGRDQHFNRP